MKIFSRIALGAVILAALTAAAPVFAQTSTWQIDPNHANAQFTVCHLGISNVQGEFTKVTGTVQIDENDISKSSVNATIDTTSLDSRVAGRDKDVKDSFLEVDKYPTMTFVSKKITKGADGKLQMTGDLTLHGVTKQVTFDVDGPSDAIKDPWGNQRRGASATAKIHRTDFGITKYPSSVVGEDIAIQLDVEFIKKS
jgi:polyisoprenoid-binding protein YceI